MAANTITMKASTKNQPYPDTKMCLRITAVIETTINPAPDLQEALAAWAAHQPAESGEA